MAIQTVNLADNINAAILKINQNFDEIEAGNYGGTSTSDVTNIVNNILDSDYFLSIINQTYIEQFTISTSVDFTDVDAGIAANASAVSSLSSSITNIDGTLLILAQDIVTLNTSYTNVQTGVSANSSAISSLTSSISSTDSDLLVVAAAQTALEVEVDGLVLDGVDSAVLASAIASANSSLQASISAVGADLVVTAGDVTTLNTGLALLDTNTGIATAANSAATAALTSTVSSIDGVVTAQGQDIVTLNEQIDITNAAGVLSTAIADAETDLRAEIAVVDGRITSANATLQTTLNTKIDDDIATAQTTLQTNIDALGGVTSTWNLDLVAGTEANPHIAGIKFGNDGALAEFAITADTFKIINASNSEIQPFTVDGNNIVLSNATVTGGLNIGTAVSGSYMSITDDVIEIYENDQRRVKLGNLS